MKNNVKFLLCASFIYLAGTGCNKTDNTPQVPPNGFTIQSDSFKAGVIGVHQLGLVGTLQSPQITFKNVPKGTEQFIAVLEDDAKHIYWSAAISGTVRNLNAAHAGTGPMYHPTDVMTTIKHYKAPLTVNRGKNCTLTVVALHAALTELEWAKIRHPEKHLTREEFVKMLSSIKLDMFLNINNRIGGLTKEVYSIRIPQITIRPPQSVN